MIGNQKHIIKKLNLDINTNSADIARQFHRNFGAIFKSEILPELEKLFNSLAPDRIIRLEKLDLNLKNVRKSDFVFDIKRQLIENFKKEFEEKLLESPTSGKSIEVLTESEKNWETFFHFLKKGRLPWWAKNVSISELEKKLNTNLEREPIPKRRFSQFTKVEFQRLSRQFSGTFLISLLKKIDKEISNLGNDYFQQYQISKDSKLGKLILENIFEIASSETISKKELKENWKNIIHKKVAQLGSNLKLPSNLKKELKEYSEFKQSDKEELKENWKNISHKKVAQLGSNLKLPSNLKRELKEHSEFKQSDKKELKKSTSVSFPTPKEAEQGIIVSHSGLVILQPFLLYLFKGFDWLENGTFKNDALQERAIHLLYFLSSGQEFPEEDELVFCKFLCGFPIEKPIEKQLELSENEKSEAINLLNAVLQHWTALTGTSPAGLRGNFLIRKGKLIKKENNWKLQIERKAQDILLAKLPWGFSMIRFGWMKEILVVEW